MRSAGIAMLTEVLQKVPKTHKSGLHKNRTCHAGLMHSCVMYYML